MAQILNFLDFRARKVCRLMYRYGLNPERSNELFWSSKVPIVWAKYNGEWINVDELINDKTLGDYDEAS